MLRLKLSFFGATRFDPRSDRWVRITMYQGAHLMKEISKSNDTWSYKKIAECTHYMKLKQQLKEHRVPKD